MSLYDLIPLTIIVCSLATIIAIVVRKFNVLATLDVSAIQAEREAKFKEQLIGARLKRRYYRYFSAIRQFLAPVGVGIAAFFRARYASLQRFRQESALEAAPAAQEVRQVARLFAEARQALESDKVDEAEQRYIEIIGLEAQNVTAFRELGELYYHRKDYNEARETLAHALRLAEKQPSPVEREAITDAPADYRTATASIRADLASASLALEDAVSAREHIDSAISIEPANPRYLDMKLQISIMDKDKIAALDAYGKLKNANPENQKLGEFKQQIDLL